MPPISRANPRLLRFLKQRRDTYRPRPAPIARYLELKRAARECEAAE